MKSVWLGAGCRKVRGGGVYALCGARENTQCHSNLRKSHESHRENLHGRAVDKNTHRKCPFYNWWRIQIVWPLSGKCFDMGELIMSVCPKRTTSQQIPLNIQICGFQLILWRTERISEDKKHRGFIKINWKL